MFADRLGTGDEGYTDLMGPERVPKYDLRPETYGTLDEATSALGLARAYSKVEKTQEILRQVQHDLYLMMAEVATPLAQLEKIPYRITAEQADWLDTTIRDLETEVEMPKAFILPGASAASAAIDLGRTIVRRAERHAVELVHKQEMPPGNVLRYLNRLSSLLFVLARYEEFASGTPFNIARR
ncbi:MAG TPA: cob(I)yrinic acid a,c-diamide adenosyltransferase [Chloroflexia bacterium]|nr:cob(I)yrinic acid a,c-diamide adenosyltransferase [Chloroflexia bacterium]